MLIYLVNQNEKKAQFFSNRESKRNIGNRIGQIRSGQKIS